MAEELVDRTRDYLRKVHDIKGRRRKSDTEEVPLPGGDFETLMADPERLTPAFRLAILVTVLSLAPALVMMVTCFVRVVVVTHARPRESNAMSRSCVFVPPNIVVKSKFVTRRLGHSIAESPPPAPE